MIASDISVGTVRMFIEPTEPITGDIQVTGLTLTPGGDGDPTGNLQVTGLTLG